jgi:hypothetical protein
MQIKAPPTSSHCHLPYNTNLEDTPYAPLPSCPPLSHSPITLAYCLTNHPCLLSHLMLLPITSSITLTYCPHQSPLPIISPITLTNHPCQLLSPIASPITLTNHLHQSSSPIAPPITLTYHPTHHPCLPPHPTLTLTLSPVPSLDALDIALLVALDVPSTWPCPRRALALYVPLPLPLPSTCPCPRRALAVAMP